MQIPEVTKDDLINWLRKLKPEAFVGTTCAGDDCLLFHYFHDQGIDLYDVNPSYDRRFKRGRIKETAYTGRQMTEFEDRVGTAFDKLLSTSRDYRPVTAAEALAMLEDMDA